MGIFINSKILMWLSISKYFFNKCLTELQFWSLMFGVCTKLVLNVLAKTNLVPKICDFGRIRTINGNETMANSQYQITVSQQV